MSSETPELRYPTKYTETLEDASRYYKAAYEDLSSAEINSIYLGKVLEDTTVFDDEDVKRLLPDFSSDKEKMNELIKNIDAESDSFIGDLTIFAFTADEFIKTIARVEEYLAEANASGDEYKAMMDSLTYGMSLELFFGNDTKWSDSLLEFFKAEAKAMQGVGKTELKKLFTSYIEDGINKDLAKAGIGFYLDSLTGSSYDAFKKNVIDVLKKTVKDSIAGSTDDLAGGLADASPILGSLGGAIFQFACNEVAALYGGKDAFDLEVLETNATKVGISVVSSMLGKALAGSLGLSGTTGGAALGAAASAAIMYVATKTAEKIQDAATHAIDGLPYEFEEITPDTLLERMKENNIIHETPVVDNQTIYDIKADLENAGVDKGACNYISALYGGREDLNDFFIVGNEDSGLTIGTPARFATRYFLTVCDTGVSTQDIMASLKSPMNNESSYYTEQDWNEVENILETLSDAYNESPELFTTIQKDFESLSVSDLDLEMRYAEAVLE